MDKATVVSYPDEFSKIEILELAQAAGYEVVDVMSQRQIVKSEYGVGPGKAEELRDMISRNGSKTLIVDESLTSSQAFKLATITRAEIVDRERLILNIFARRARTTEAKLQVQLAELRYELPRARDEVRYSVAGERAGFMGMGETAVDVRFRALKRRMASSKRSWIGHSPAARSTEWKEENSGCRSYRSPAIQAAGKRRSSTNSLLSRARNLPACSRRSRRPRER